MTEEPNQITPLKNSEDHQKLVSDYEAKIQEHKTKAEGWKNAAIKAKEKALEREKEKERLEQERDDWKREAFASRKVHLEQKETKNKNDFLAEFTNRFNQKLQNINNKK